MVERLDMPLRNILNVVVACMCLHNLCIIHGASFGMEWAQKTEQTMQVEANHFRREFQHKDIFHLAKHVIKKRC
jgi:hypothetical protein